MAPGRLVQLVLLISSALLSSSSQSHANGDAAATHHLDHGEPATALLFAYFRTESETLHYAVSRDGLHWIPLNNNEPVMTPTQGAASVRDPFIERLPNGDGFSLVTTNGWWSRSIVYYRSRTLLDWSEGELLPVMEAVDGIKNAWAPETHFDPDSGRVLLYWSSSGADDYNRIWRSWADYSFSNISAPEVLFDPGYTVIDADIITFANRQYMFFKDERDSAVSSPATTAAAGGALGAAAAGVSAASGFLHGTAVGGEGAATGAQEQAQPHLAAGGAKKTVPAGIVQQAVGAVAAAARRSLRSVKASVGLGSGADAAAASSAAAQLGSPANEGSDPAGSTLGAPAGGHGDRWVPSHHTRSRERSEERKMEAASSSSSSSAAADQAAPILDGSFLKDPPGGSGAVAPDPDRKIAKAPKVAVGRSLDGPYTVATDFLMQPMTEGPQVYVGDLKGARLAGLAPFSWLLYADCYVQAHWNTRTSVDLINWFPVTSVPDSQCPPLPASRATAEAARDISPVVDPVSAKRSSQFDRTTPEEAYQALFGEDYTAPLLEEGEEGASSAAAASASSSRRSPAQFPPTARHGTFLRISERELLALVGRFGIGVGPEARAVGARAAQEGFGMQGSKGRSQGAGESVQKE